MSTFDTNTHDTGDDLPGGRPGTERAHLDGIEIRILHAAPEMSSVVDVFQQVWGSVTEIVRLEMLMAISHAGGYVAAAYDMSQGERDRGRIVGASVALLATHGGKPALHSHVTGILPGVRSSGLGRAMKLHQQQWARERDIEWIVWTFDPLVRRNAWFNIAVLGAEAHQYLPDFYGTMTDAINAGDTSDRLLVAWSVFRRSGRAAPGRHRHRRLDGGPHRHAGGHRHAAANGSGCRRTMAAYHPRGVLRGTRCRPAGRWLHPRGRLPGR